SRGGIRIRSRPGGACMAHTTGGSHRTARVDWDGRRKRRPFPFVPASPMSATTPLWGRTEYVAPGRLPAGDMSRALLRFGRELHPCEVPSRRTLEAQIDDR